MYLCFTLYNGVMSEVDPSAELRWLLLFHQLPPKPAYLQVKTQRRLQSVGAVAHETRSMPCPASAEALEDLQWLRREIVEGGGEASICEARPHRRNHRRRSARVVPGGP